MANPEIKSAILASVFAALALTLPFYGCLTGSEIPNEIEGSLVEAGGSASIGARVSLIPADRIPGADAPPLPVVSVEADADGRYRFSKVPAGTYNLVASNRGLSVFRDSIFVDRNSGRNVGRDTLDIAGSLTGLVLLEGADNPRIALVQVIGTEIYVNVDATGRFTLTDMPAGRYRIRVFVSGDDFVPEFRVIEIRAGKADTLAESISPFYQGQPYISGLTAVALPDGSIRLFWKPTRYSKPFRYGVFREPMDVTWMSGNAMAYLTDSIFVDTIYSESPRPDPLGYPRERWPEIPYGGQFPLADNTAYRFQYKVWAFNNEGQTLGTPSAYVKVTAIPPAKAGTASP